MPAVCRSFCFMLSVLLMFILPNIYQSFHFFDLLCYSVKADSVILATCSHVPLRLCYTIVL